MEVVSMAVEALTELAVVAEEVAEATAEATSEVGTLGSEAVEVSGGLGFDKALEVGGTDGTGYFNPETETLRNSVRSAEDAERFESELPDQLEACNPNYELDECWRINCQRCVPTYEMRMRGYDVTAMEYYGDDFLSYHPFAVWKDPEVIQCADNGLDQIKEQMAEWGDGARAQIVVSWEGTGTGGHTFVAEQVNGKTRFFDPQTHETDVEYYFDMVESGSVKFCRMDQLEVNEDLINDCCKPVEV